MSDEAVPVQKLTTKSEIVIVIPLELLWPLFDTFPIKIREFCKISLFTHLSRFLSASERHPQEREPQQQKKENRFRPRKCCRKI
jgi:hypothetical protein